MNDELIPTGAFIPVYGTPLDFRKMKAIGDDIDSPFPSIRCARGFDHCFILQRDGTGPAIAAQVEDPLSGRRMQIATTHPCIVFYSGNGCDGVIPGKSGAIAGDRSAFCLEPQGYTDAPNRPEFPKQILRPGMKYLHRNDYHFSTF